MRATRALIKPHSRRNPAKWSQNQAESNKNRIKIKLNQAEIKPKSSPKPATEAQKPEPKPKPYAERQPECALESSESCSPRWLPGPGRGPQRGKKCHETMSGKNL